MTHRTIREIIGALSVRRYLIEHWLHRGVLNPSSDPEPGKAREYSEPDALAISIVRDLSDAGLTLERVAKAFTSHPVLAKTALAEDGFLVISYEDTPSPHGVLWMPGSALRARVIAHSEIVTFLSDPLRRVAVVIPLARHVETIREIFED